MAGFTFTELQEATLSLSEEMPFSLSVWLTSPGRELPRDVLEGSLSLGTGRPADLLLMLESMLLVLHLFPAPFRLLDLLGLGKLRYCKFVRELRDRYPSSWFGAPSMLVFRPVDRPTRADDLGILPSVADLLVTVAPLAVIMASPATEPLCFLNPKLLALAVGVLELLGRVFLDSSPLLRPASDGERLTWEALGESLPFSDTLASSVFPVPGVFSVPVGADGLVLGMVMPTSAVMPLRHEPVCERTGFFLPDTLLSDSSDMSEGFRLHLEPGSIFTPLSEPPSDFLMSSPDHREFLSTCECFSASVCGQDTC